MKHIILSHSGKQHSYHVAKAMYDLDILQRFYTSVYIRNKAIQDYLLKKNNKYWTRRFIQGLPAANVDATWHFEIREILLRKLFGKKK